MADRNDGNGGDFVLRSLQPLRLEPNVRDLRTDGRKRQESDMKTNIASLAWL